MSKVEIQEREVTKKVVQKVVVLELSLPEAWWIGNLLSRTSPEGDPVDTVYKGLLPIVGGVSKYGQWFTGNEVDTTIEFSRSEREKYEKMVALNG